MKRTNLFLSAVVVVLVILTIIYASDIYFSVSDSRFNQDDKAPATTSARDVLPGNVRELYKTARKIRWEENDASKSIAFLEGEYSRVPNAPLEKAWIKLALASSYLDTQPDKGFQMLAEIYNDVEYSQFSELRGRALMYAMLAATEVGSPRLSNGDAKKWIFSPQRFGAVLGIDQSKYDVIATNEELKSLASEGLTLATNMLESRIRKVRSEVENLVLKSTIKLAEIYNTDPENYTRAYAQSRVKEDAALREHYQQVEKDANRLLSETEMLIRNTDTYDAYLSEFIYSLNYLQRVYTHLLYVGMGESSLQSISQTRTSLREYVELHGDEHQFAAKRSALIIASSDMRFACALMLKNDYKVSELEKQEIKTLLNSVYELSAEEIKAHLSLLAEAADNPYYPCHKAFVYIALEIDPAFKDFLIFRIGRWKDMHFHL